MVSFVQFRQHGEYTAAGWTAVIAPYTDASPIGGPSVLWSGAGEIIELYADGSANRLGSIGVMVGEIEVGWSRVPFLDGRQRLYLHASAAAILEQEDGSAVWLGAVQLYGDGPAGTIARQVLARQKAQSAPPIRPPPH